MLLSIAPRVFLASLIGLLFAILLDLWPYPAIAAPLSVSIDAARHQPDGIEVVVSGVVTVPSGQFASASFDQGFVIQDTAGGIYVSSDRDPQFQLGDRVEVVGTLQDDGHGQRILQMHRWQPAKQAMPDVVPRPTSIQAATTLDGQLVTLQGTITQSVVDDTPYGDRLWLKDETGTVQIYIPRSTAIAPKDLPFLQIGQHIQVTGFSSQYDQNDEIMPRWRGDIRRLGE